MSPSTPHGALRDLTGVARAVVVDHGAAPCAVVAAAALRGASWELGAGAFGRLDPTPSSRPVSLDTPFDLASLTKPVTALTLARLERRGVLSRSERLDRVVPRLAGGGAARATLDLLMAHRAGLEAHLQLYAPLLSGGTIDKEACLRAAAQALRPECAGEPPEEGFPPLYSDLGYLLVGVALEERTGQPLDDLMQREVLGPLGLAIGSARQRRLADPAFDEAVAPTEVVAWRGGAVRGAVHDENAWALAGDRAAGHAGLFGDALSVARLGAAIVDVLRAARGEFLAPEELRPLVRPRPGGSHRAGFDSKSGESPSSGTRFGDATFGHLGFTGTSLWIDPEQALVGVLLTNRVNPSREHLAIRRARPDAYDLIFAEMSD